MAYYPTDNTDKINKTFAYNVRSGIASINSEMNNKINKLNSAAAAIPAQYNRLKNQLTLNFRKTKKADEEYIANTGNHTASGYAVSKRMNTNNAYNNSLNNINLEQSNALNNIEAEKRQARYDAENKKREFLNKNSMDKLDYTLKEAARLDEEAAKREGFEIEWAKHNENKRVNSANINKINAETEKIQSDTVINKENHDLDMMYEPEERQTKIDKTKAETDNIHADTDGKKANTKLIEAKTATEIVNKELAESKVNLTKAQTNKINNPSTGKKSSGGSKTSSSSLTKMSASELAKNITAQTGTKRKNASGNVYYDPNPQKAYVLLMEFKKKYNLSPQMVNDTAIYLGVQNYF